MTAQDGLLRCVIVSGNELSRDICHRLAGWYSQGLVDDALVVYADEADLSASAPLLPVRRLSEFYSLDDGPQKRLDLLHLAADDNHLRAMRGVLLHDADLGADLAYAHRYEGIRSLLEQRLPHRVRSAEGELISLRVVNLFAPAPGGAPFAEQAAREIQAPSVVLAKEDRAQPDGVADIVRRDGSYVSHAAAAAATLTGLWRGFPLPELEQVLLQIADSRDQARAFRQMVRITKADEPLDRLVDEVAAVMRGADSGMADLKTVRRGPATDRRLLDGAMSDLRGFAGDPLGFAPPQRYEHRSVLSDGRRKRWAFARQEFIETFETAWRRWLLNRDRRRHRDLIGDENPYKTLAEQADLPGRRVQQVKKLSQQYDQGLHEAQLDPDVEVIPPEFLLRIKQRAFALVDGGAQAEGSADAVAVVSDRDLVAPRPDLLPAPSDELRDLLGFSADPFTYLDLWRTGGWLHQLDALTLPQPAAATMEAHR